MVIACLTDKKFLTFSFTLISLLSSHHPLTDQGVFQDTPITTTINNIIKTAPAKTSQ